MTDKEISKYSNWLKSLPVDTDLYRPASDQEAFFAWINSVDEISIAAKLLAKIFNYIPEEKIKLYDSYPEGIKREALRFRLGCFNLNIEEKLNSSIIGNAEPEIIEQVLR